MIRHIVLIRFRSDIRADTLLPSGATAELRSIWERDQSPQKTACGKIKSS